MAITQLTPLAEIDAYMNVQVERIERALVRTLSYVGESCRNEAIKSHRYKNQTGNLESSVGYVVVVNGRVAKTGGFKKVKKGRQGSTEGRDYALSLASKLTSGICLLVVAGKNYAAYVNDKGLNVLDSAEQWAEMLVPEMLEKLKF